MGIIFEIVYVDMEWPNASLTGVQQNATDECIFVLLGNKKDLPDAREVTEKEALKYAESIGAKYYETCSTTGEGMVVQFKFKLWNL